MQLPQRTLFMIVLLINTLLWCIGLLLSAPGLLYGRNALKRSAAGSFPDSSSSSDRWKPRKHRNPLGAY